MEYWLCSCYYSNNIFLRQYKLHVSFYTVEQFLFDYTNTLNAGGCVTEGQIKEVIQEVEEEIKRRRKGGEDHLERCRRVNESYTRLHPQIYVLSNLFLDACFLEVVDLARSTAVNPEDIIELLKEEDAPNTYSFPVFTPNFCQTLMEELEHFEQTDLPKGRPNTMNKGGVLLSELGFDNFIDDLRVNYLMPVARLLYPDLVGEGLDSHRAFVVKYSMDQDVELSYHYDNAEVTLNVCLTSAFTGGQLYFGPMRQDRHHYNRPYHSYQHVLGRGLIHRGQHMHGACPITSGHRYNLIVWMRASSVRNKLCPMCDKTPNLVPNTGFGDGFMEKGRNQECVTV